MRPLLLAPFLLAFLLALAAPASGQGVRVVPWIGAFKSFGNPTGVPSSVLLVAGSAVLRPWLTDRRPYVRAGA